MKHIISLGAGVQSSTMALLAARGEIQPAPIGAIFADTQGEPRSVYDWLDWLEQQLPFPVYRVTQGNLATRDSTVRRSKKSGNLYRSSMIPAFTKDANGRKGMLPRKCTRDYKIAPIYRCAKKLANVPRSGWKHIYVTQWIGISTDEAHRMKPSPRPWSENRWPLIELGMSRQDCLAWMAENKFPRPPRSSCVYCPFHSDREWLRLKNEEPAEFERAVRYERKMQRAAKKDEVATGVPYLHSSRIPLSRVELSESDSSGWGNECEGLCGV